MNNENSLIHEKTDSDKTTYPIRKLNIREDYVMIILEEDKIMIPVESYFSYKIKDLKELDAQLLADLKKEERYLKAYRSCLRKLSVKDQTVRQIKDHLKNKGLDPQESDQIVKKLTDYGLLDDEKYAESKSNYYDRSNLSVRQIKDKLKKDGIKEETIDKYLKNDEARERSKAESIAERYGRTIRNKSLVSKKKAIVGKLLGSGFSYDLARNVVDAMEISDENEIELLNREYLKARTKYGKKYSEYELKQRIYLSLLNKGFSSENIKKVMEENDG